ncbi:hypothetical protein IQ22_02878 [Pseudomonas duriflava]|uniref:Uncharacterized protein n=1 Tax=Pseudomonas duriflava TaxID=459528 RepID=A0A562Q8I7_9PSED|nr:hypothetical protein IQ22_02878 [Pseudomonas duriflava]
MADPDAVHVSQGLQADPCRVATKRGGVVAPCMFSNLTRLYNSVAKKAYLKRLNVLVSYLTGLLASLQIGL